METFSDSKGGLGARFEAFSVDGPGALWPSLHWELRARGGAFPPFRFVTSAFRIHLPWLRYVGGGCLAWVWIKKCDEEDKHVRKRLPEVELTESQALKEKQRRVGAEGGHYSMKETLGNSVEWGLTTVRSDQGSLKEAAAARTQHKYGSAPQRVYSWEDICKIHRWQHK